MWKKVYLSELPADSDDIIFKSLLFIKIKIRAEMI